MAVVRQLEPAGVKLILQHRNELSEAERQELLAWGDDGAAIEAMREHLLARTAGLSASQAKELPRPHGEPWQQSEQLPVVLTASCAHQLGLELTARGWAKRNELRRFALAKLSHPGHEHRNLPRALAEFGLLV
jgi:hypothetical protein